MDKMGDEILKTLKQILERQLKINAWIDYTTLTKEQVINLVKEWLQQYDEDWSINGLLEQLDQ